MTYDGSDWVLYLDGEIGGTANTGGATPRYDSIQHFGIGTAMDSGGNAEGSFNGAIDEVRVWNAPRSQVEIQAGMFETITSGQGLVARWGLDASDGTTAVDTLGDHPGTIVGGANWTSPGAPPELNQPPALPSTPTPADQATVPAGDVTLSVDVNDADGDDVIVTFHARPLPEEEEDFSVVVLPDTQYYSEGYPQIFAAQTQWVMDNLEAYNIEAVIHVGDLVESGNQFESEWTAANTAMSALEASSTAFPDGLPYGIAVGNHDQSPIGTPGGTDKFNEYFGVDRFDGRVYYGGHYQQLNDNSWWTFEAAGRDFLVMQLEYDTSQDAGPLAWAEQVIDDHPDHIVIVNVHYLIGTGNPAGFGSQGQAIYDAMKTHPNVRLMVCGHIGGEGQRTDVYDGNTIHTLLGDYQFRTNGGDGWLRLMEFDPAGGELTIRTYSPTLDQWESDADSEFTLELDLGGSAAPFEQQGFAEEIAAGGTAQVVMSDLAPGTYEWYAELTDCLETTVTPVYELTVQ